MKRIFSVGDKKVYRKTIGKKDLAAFHGEVLHDVYATFALARDFEWSSRLFFIEMKDEDEEGVGTYLEIFHRSPAFAGEEVVITATVDKVEGNELICRINAYVGTRLVANGRTGQRMLKKTRLQELQKKS
jgi:fluoroacetyl-CoA thioesterase